MALFKILNVLYNGSTRTTNRLCPVACMGDEPRVCVEVRFMRVSDATSRPIAFGGSYPWLRSKRWDLTYISLSAVLVAIPILLHYQLGVSTSVINVAVALAVGGPHMYSTFSVTFLEQSFLRQHPYYAASALLIPILVVYGALVNLTLLLTVFMFWASIHVLHQITYLVDCYRRKGKEPETLWSRGIDYAAVLTSLYPFATYKLITGQFVLENRVLMMPEIFRSDLIIHAAWAAFLVAQLLFVTKTASEFVRGTANIPKIILMSITIVLAFIVPTFDNLDVAFQGLNTWHSVQYLGMMYYLNELRKARGEISSRLVQKLIDGGRPPRFYLFNVGITFAAAMTVVVMVLLFGFGFLVQSYYIVILSCLLIHYYFDHFLFMRTTAEVAP